ncbi:MAPEG family protein [Granulosicoccus sp. 3-233]|uniref:MAPEG family protein n=1 Tax=Granulosicoccus sp. 3-233 TaxID=3417969 RepID=UPI003D328CF0
MLFSTTPIYALAIALIWLVLWLRVSALRSRMGQSMGDGGNPVLLQRIRQHGNCADWSALVLILMILAEGMNTSALYLHISGALLVLGRVAHPFGLQIDNAAHPLRYVGNGSNILATINLMVCMAVNLPGL